MMNRRALDIWVGFFVALGFAAIMFLALKVASSATLAAADGYEVKGKFDNIGGLKVRAPVKSAGVVVGRVAAIRFDNESFEAVVSMNVDKRYQFPQGHCGEDPHLGAPRRAVRRPHRRGRHRQPQGRRHVENYPIRARPREPDRAVPVQ